MNTNNFRKIAAGVIAVAISAGATGSIAYAKITRKQTPPLKIQKEEYGNFRNGKKFFRKLRL